MKTLVFFTFLLVVVYAANPDAIKKFHEQWTECADELSAPEKKNTNVVVCVLEKQKLIEGNIFIIEKGIESLVDLISDKAKIQQATEIIHNCYDHAYEGPGSDKEKTKKAVECAKSIMDLIDNP